MTRNREVRDLMKTRGKAEQTLKKSGHSALQICCVLHVETHGKNSVVTSIDWQMAVK